LLHIHLKNPGHGQNAHTLSGFKYQENVNESSFFM